MKILNLHVFYSSSVILSKQLWGVYKEDFYLPDVLLIDFDPAEPVALQTQDAIVFYPSVYILKELTYFWIDVEVSHRVNAILENE